MSEPSPPLATENRLDPELKAKWVEALRSGRYEQGVSLLHRDGAFCCLGVLAHVIDTPIETINGKGCLPCVLANAVMPWDAERETQKTLEDMNDGNDGERKHSFPEIADWIEANL